MCELAQKVLEVQKLCVQTYSCKSQDLHPCLLFIVIISAPAPVLILNINSLFKTVQLPYSTKVYSTIYDNIHYQNLLGHIRTLEGELFPVQDF